NSRETAKLPKNQSISARNCQQRHYVCREPSTTIRDSTLCIDRVRRPPASSESLKLAVDSRHPHFRTDGLSNLSHESGYQQSVPPVRECCCSAHRVRSVQP